MKKTKYPRIYLTLDNCFAIKRWVCPSQWMPLIKEIGFESIQASFDNEIDFLYSPDWYIEKWFQEVREQEVETGVQVDTFYTGYQTYRTAGLAHPDDQMANYLMDHWVKKAVEWVGKKKAYMGVSFFAMTLDVLQDPGKYQMVYEKVINRLQTIAKYAKQAGIVFCSEAMYAPHQPSWTIAGTKQLLKDCYKNGHPIYTTVDVGHMIGQDRFLRPEESMVVESIRQAKKGAVRPEFWLGAEHTQQLWRTAVKNGDDSARAVQEIMDDIERYSYLFSEAKDSSEYAWLKELGCYSPILHMQQTNGITASHAAFTSKTNENGIIKGEKLLKAIKDSYDQPEEAGMPPKAEKIYLAFEIFASNTEYPHEIINKLKETAAYWKQFVPENGIRLDDLVARLSR